MSDQPSQAWLQAERNRQWRKRLRYTGIYAILTAFAVLMLFPFLYMFFTSLKTANDVFHYPPRLFPFSPVQIDYNGTPTNQYIFNINGQERRLILDPEGKAVPHGYFTTEDKINAAAPETSLDTIPVRLDTAVKTDTPKTIGGEEFDVYTVTINGQTQDLVLAYRRGLKRFFDPNDSAIEVYAIERTATPVETIVPQFGNYQVVLELKNLSRALVNTTVVTIGVTAGQVITSLLGGYAFSRIQFRGREALFVVYLGTIMIPFIVLIIPLYQLMVILGWQQHLAALIIPWLFTAYGTFLMRQFFITIPKELEEAAFLDGLNRFGILWRVFVPLSGPAIATQAIITFLYAWNSFVWPLVIISDSAPQRHVITLALNQLRNATMSEPNLMLTGAAMTILPPLVVFLLAQRYFVEGIASTGLK